MISFFSTFRRVALKTVRASGATASILPHNAATARAAAVADPYALVSPPVSGVWILAGGVWNDAGSWSDSAIWIG